MTTFISSTEIDSLSFVNFTGRTPLTTSETVVTRGNIVDLVKRALWKHRVNILEIDYLWRYYHGVQPILDRVKVLRPEINNKIVENHAQEIVTFFNGYFLGDPITYSRFGEQDTTEEIKSLNSFMREANKERLDLELSEWLFICGVGYRIALPGTTEQSFITDVLDPRKTFVVRSNAIGRNPLFAVEIVKKDDGTELYCGYTAEAYFEIKDETVTEWVTHTMGHIPIIEYTANNIRMGAFEPVISLLDAINLATSNRLDGVEQFIQNLMVLYNADVDESTLEQIKAYGLIKLLSPEGLQADVKFIQQQLDQADTQVLIDSMLQTVKDIIGMPNRVKGLGGGSSGNVGSVIMWQGWELCAARTQIIEGFFKASEREFLQLILGFLRVKQKFDLSVGSIDIKFTRRQYDASITKVQILQGLLAAGVDKESACTTCGLFADPLSVAAKMTDKDNGGVSAETGAAQNGTATDPQPTSTGSDPQNSQ